MLMRHNPDSKVHGTNMGPTWVLSAPDGPHVGPMNLAIKEDMTMVLCALICCGHYQLLMVHVMYLPIIFRDDSLAMEQSYDGLSARELILR